MRVGRAGGGDGKCFYWRHTSCTLVANNVMRGPGAFESVASDGFLVRLLKNSKATREKERERP